jgi:predicted peptidase
MRWILTMTTIALTTACGFAAEPEAHVFKSDGKTLPYRLLKPADTKAGEKYPLVIFLHGAGERGVDNKKQLVWFWNDKKPSVMTRPEVAKEKAFVIVPQCPEGKQFVDVPWGKGSYKSPEISEPLKLTLALIDSFIKDNPIDPDRVYIIGMSMGGFGALDAVQRRPELFAACVSICGAGDLSKAKDIAHVPVWARDDRRVEEGRRGPEVHRVPEGGAQQLVAGVRGEGVLELDLRPEAQAQEVKAVRDDGRRVGRVC